jgi:glycosyltransferase involved in cell wall biosynthesis
MQILHLHGGGTPDFMNTVLRLPFARGLLTYFFTRFDKIIAVSEPLRKELFEVFDKNKLSLTTRSNWYILHNAIDVPKALAKPTVYTAGSRLKILFVGRFEKEKNLPTIIAIARQLKSREVSAHITLVGDGSLAVQVKEQIRASDVEDFITLQGWVNYEEIDRVYRAHHMFLIPSIHESFGIVVLEAYKNGLAVLSSTAGGLKEIVIDRETGYTFDAHDVDGFTSKIRELVDNPEQLAKLQVNAQKFVRHFDYETHIKELRKIVGV